MCDTENEQRDETILGVEKSHVSCLYGSHLPLLMKSEWDHAEPTALQCSVMASLQENV